MNFSWIALMIEILFPRSVMEAHIHSQDTEGCIPVDYTLCLRYLRAGVYGNVYSEMTQVLSQISWTLQSPFNSLIITALKYLTEHLGME